MQGAAKGPARTVQLRTPPVPCLVPPGVFDAFGWCASDVLEWRRPTTRWECEPSLDGSNPAGMVFVMREPCEFLPRELARLHAFGLGLESEEALAPWAIDDAADLLYERRTSPGECFWLAADNIKSLFWGLHDWAHFHSHGPFQQRAWTELQCDISALAWLWASRHAAEVDAAVWDTMRSGAESLSRERFRVEGLAFDEAAFRSEHILSLVGSPESDGASLHQLLQDPQSVEPRHPAHVEDGFERGRSVDE
jgi:hypothetical protein